MFKKRRARLWPHLGDLETISFLVSVGFSLMGESKTKIMGDCVAYV